MMFFQDLPNVLNSLILLGLLSLLFRLRKKPKTSTMLFVVFLGWFYLTSTFFFPSFLVKQLEQRYNQFDEKKYQASKDTFYILVLASGYSVDERLSATNQLDLNSLGRLVEGIRIKRNLKSSILICSGYSAFGIESQASVTRRAAIELGISKQEILLLETPSSTSEEVEHFYKQFGRRKNVILVTDAFHMKRASFFFNQFGIQVIPAPTNFRGQIALNDDRIKWIPSLGNIQLMDLIIHEYLGYVKFYLKGILN